MKGAHIAILYRVFTPTFAEYIKLIIYYSELYYFRNFSFYINDLYSLFNFTVSVWIFMRFFCAVINDILDKSLFSSLLLLSNIFMLLKSITWSLSLTWLNIADLLIYAGILNDRLENVIENNLSETQFGFRKGRGTVDCIYILNYLINREIGKKSGKLFVFFGDLKAAFDMVNRQKLKECMEKIKVGKKLKDRILETYVETKNKVRINKEVTNEFWTSTGVRQGCP